MFINRKQLAEIIASEVRARLVELADDSDEGDGGDGKRKRPKKPSTADAEDSPSPRGEGPPGPIVDPQRDSDPGSGPQPADPNGTDDDAAVDSSDDESDALDPDGDAGEDPTGAVNNDIAGKVVQAVTIEPHSKILPGAKEVVITFGDSSDALRIGRAHV